MNVGASIENMAYRNTAKAVESTLKEGLLRIVRHYTVHNIEFGSGTNMHGSMTSALYGEVRVYQFIFLATDVKGFKR